MTLYTPVALSIVWESMKDQQLSTSEKLELLCAFDAILGFGIDSFTAPDLSDTSYGTYQRRRVSNALCQKDLMKAEKLRDS